MVAATGPPLVAHVIQHLIVGGLENGLVNLINRMADDRYRHAVLCLKGYSDFRNRLARNDVPVYALDKREGKDLMIHWKLYRLFRKLRPQIVHTRNLSALESVIPAALARVPCRVHGEHGWDAYDLDGTNRRYRRLRRALKPLVHQYIALSIDLERYLINDIGVHPSKVSRICNGVDVRRFRPAASKARRDQEPHGMSGQLVIGWVGRMEFVKDPLNLVRAFLRLRELRLSWRSRLTLVMIGGGSMAGEVRRCLEASGALGSSWLPGSRNDVPEQLRLFDVFVLPSRAEGISNTILEAMASGCPVVATNVGGNPELVLDGETGRLVPPGDSEALARAVEYYLLDGALRRRHGRAARARAENEFSIARMVDRYASLYDSLIEGRGLAGSGGAA